MHANFHFVDRANEILDPRAADLRQQAWQGLFVNLVTAHSVLPQLNLLLLHGAEHSEQSAPLEGSERTNKPKGQHWD